MSSSQAAELQTAIQQGNIEQSQMLARQLAEARAKVIVRIEDGSNAAVTPELTDIIRYNVVLDCFLTVLSIPGLSLVCWSAFILPLILFTSWRERQEDGKEMVQLHVTLLR